MANRVCIICGKSAGSREHIFPAALGGRRINKGIYCARHNEAFGPLANVLANQLAQLNALLAVRPDHSDLPRRVPIENPANGQRYLISAFQAEQTSPRIVRDVVEDGLRNVEVRFSNEEQMQRWFRTQREAGHDLLKKDRQDGIAFFTRPIPMSFEIGGPNGMAAIGYIALTFLAHYFPTVAGYTKLLEFKNSVQNPLSDQNVWWDLHSGMSESERNPFPFGHTIIIGLSKTEGAHARVSLFSTFEFAVHLGTTTDIESDRTVITHIDPQADSPPLDIRETRLDSAVFSVRIPASKTASLERSLDSGELEVLFGNLQARISRWQLEQIAKRMLEKITAECGSHSGAILSRTTQILHENAQLVVNLMRHTAWQMKQNFADNSDKAFLVDAIELMVAEDPDSPTGLSQTALCTLALIERALANQINHDSGWGQLTLESVFNLLGGKRGAKIAARAMMEPLYLALGIPPSELGGCRASPSD